MINRFIDSTRITLHYQTNGTKITGLYSIIWIKNLKVKPSRNLHVQPVWNKRSVELLSFIKMVQSIYLFLVFEFQIFRSKNINKMNSKFIFRSRKVQAFLIGNFIILCDIGHISSSNSLNWKIPNKTTHVLNNCTSYNKKFWKNKFQFRKLYEKFELKNVFLLSSN